MKKQSKPWLIKFGGSLLSSDKARKTFLKDVVRLAKKKPVVLVHGGGPEITAALAERKIPAQFVKGRRATSPAGMVVVEQILSGQVNKQLVAELNSLGAKAAGLSGRDGDLLRARPVPGLGRVGAPFQVNPALLQTLLAEKFLPVVSSVASGSKREALNVNADEAAAALAVGLKAERLIYLTDVAGVLDADKKTIPVIRCGRLARLIKDNVITGGMIPKTMSCRNAIRKGVGEIDIIDGKDGILKMKGTRLLP